MTVVEYKKISYDFNYLCKYQDPFYKATHSLRLYTYAIICYFYSLSF